MGQQKFISVSCSSRKIRFAFPIPIGKRLPETMAHRLYMAATRAGQRPVITYVGELPEVIRSILFSESKLG